MRVRELFGEDPMRRLELMSEHECTRRHLERGRLRTLLGQQPAASERALGELGGIPSRRLAECRLHGARREQQPVLPERGLDERCAGRLDEPASFGVTSKDWGDELDVVLEWEAGGHVVVTGVIGVLFPGAAAEEYAGGSDNWIHAMAYVNFSF